MASSPTIDQCRRIQALLVPVAVGGSTLAIAAAIWWSGGGEPMMFAGFLFPAVLCFSQSKRPVVFAAAVGLMLLAAPDVSSSGSLVHAQRTFFGIYRVRIDKSYRRLYHGTTLHGMQK